MTLFSRRVQLFFNWDRDILRRVLMPASRRLTWAYFNTELDT